VRVRGEIVRSGPERIPAGADEHGAPLDVQPGEVVGIDPQAARGNPRRGVEHDAGEIDDVFQRDAGEVGAVRIAVERGIHVRAAVADEVVAVDEERRVTGVVRARRLARDVLLAFERGQPGEHRHPRVEAVRQVDDMPRGGGFTHDQALLTGELQGICPVGRPLLCHSEASAEESPPCRCHRTQGDSSLRLGITGDGGGCR